ncbi:hypothetical protein VTN31DRAFT_2612 [Thermomyces dupontii]|uniref:uncharacterized protein n=1 Tax=Talaromyces thermophilus TaxID=28565 RepID=UPI0037437251
MLYKSHDVLLDGVDVAQERKQCCLNINRIFNQSITFRVNRFDTLLSTMAPCQCNACSCTQGCDGCNCASCGH